jgi:hypothetical protein
MMMAFDIDEYEEVEADSIGGGTIYLRAMTRKVRSDERVANIKTNVQVPCDKFIDLGDMD